MPTLQLVTEIHASLERCFDLARDVDVHRRTTDFTQERVVGGVQTGLLDLGDTVTFEGVHFGIRQRLTARIVQMERPHRFVDEMVSGAFASLRHIHEFSGEGGLTVMTDILIWRSPFGILGRCADSFVGPHLRSFLLRRNRDLKRIAESQIPA
jgi:ligand-binding SRPBCC domain-containing protein